MTTFYLDTSAIGNEYQAYADTPATWAMPQDGNGKAGPAHAAAVSVCELTFAAVPTSGAISVYGVTVTLTGVLSAASTDAAATALASSINATTTATGAAVCQLLLALNKFVYARVKPGGGANNSIVQVMCRIAGADLNYPTNSSARVTNTFNNSAMTSPVDFTGGADGPFGYFANDATVVFGKSAATYGIFPSKAPGPGEPGASDVILVRSKRSSVNLGYTYTVSSGGIVISTPASSTRQFLVDDGTTWTGDNGQFQILLTVNTSSADCRFYNAGTLLVMSARAQYGLYIKGQVASASYAVNLQYTAGSTVFNNVLVEQGNAVGTLMLMGVIYDASMLFINSKVIKKNNSSISNAMGGAYNIIFEAVNSIFEWQGVGGNVTSLVSASSQFSSGSRPSALRFAGCQFVVDSGAYALAGMFSSGSLFTDASIKVVMENCTGFASPSAGFGAATAHGESTTFLWRDAATGSFRHETPVTSSDWVKANASSYPTLGVTTPDGTLMGFRFSWEAARLAHVRRYPAEVASFSTYYREANAVKTCAIELLVPSAEIPTKSQIYMVLTYTDKDGVVRTETTAEEPLRALLAGGSTALADGVGTGSWTLNSVTSVSSKKLAITTAYQVKQNTEISAKVFIGNAAPTGTRTIYCSPEIRLS